MTMLGASNPTIYKLIDAIKNQQVLTELKINQFFAGNVLPVNKNQSNRANRLKESVSSFGEPGYNSVQHLRRLAFCISK
jgi:hypothetical protein